MPQVRGMDDGVGHADSEGDTLRKKKKVRVREPSPLRHDGVCRRANWPFLYIFEEGRCLINTAPRRSKVTKTKQIESVGEALF